MKMDEEDKILQFDEMGLDDRILEAISKLSWNEPTLIQEKAIPLMLEGKDIHARARTGSGKTGAFAIPVINKILQSKQSSTVQEVKALVLAPSKELCKQIFEQFQALTAFCSREVRCIYLSSDVPLASQKSQLSDKPDVVVGTPSRILAHLEAHILDVRNSLEVLVVDEADLLLSCGYEADVRNIIGHLPRIYQGFLTSATLDDQATELRKLVLHNAVHLKLKEPPLPQRSQLSQYIINAEEEDKFVLMYALFKLMLIKGKTIIFVNSVSKCYRLKIFLQQFGIRTCIMNSELPALCRCNIVTKFNEGIFKIIISADEHSLENPAGINESKRYKKDLESGASRGIDFHNVSNIVNFDFPNNVGSYIHRVGRTARGTSQGSALSFVSVMEQNDMEQIRGTLAEQMGILPDEVFHQYQFNMEEVKAFRYRARDVLTAVTRVAVREARQEEIKKQLLASEKLKSYFEENPRDLAVLRHDQPLHVVKKEDHLRHVPAYMFPTSVRSQLGIASGEGGKRRHNKEQQQRKGVGRAMRKFKRKQEDSLMSCEFSGFEKDKPDKSRSKPEFKSGSKRRKT